MAKISGLPMLAAGAVDGSETALALKGGVTYQAPTGTLMAPHLAQGAAYAALTQATAASLRRAFVIDYGDTRIAEAPRYRCDQGRYFRNAAGHWEPTTLADQEAIHYDTASNQLGIDLSPGETYQSANFNTGAAPAAGAPLAMVKGTSSTDASVAYAGGHVFPSVFGTVGRGVAISIGTALFAQQFRWTNIPVAFVAGDLVRLEAIVGFSGFAAAENMQLLAQTISGTAPNLTVTLAVGADNKIASITSSARRYDFVEFGTYGGVTFYFVWVEAKATATGAIAPAFQSSAYTAGARTILVEDLRTVKNGATVPNMAPVCAVNKVFGDSYIQLPTERAINLKLSRLRKGRTRVTDGAIRPVREWRSTADNHPYVHAENRIELELSEEPDSRTYPLPCKRFTLDATPPNLSEPFYLCLGDYYYDADITVPSASVTYPTFEIRGAFKAPKRWGQYRSLTTNRSRLTGDQPIIHTHQFMRASTSAEQIGQNFTNFSSIGAAGLTSVTESFFSAHTQHHSRGDKRTYHGETYDSEDCRWLGAIQWVCASLKLRDVGFNRMARAFQLNAGGDAVPFVTDADGVRGERLWSDFWYLERGVFSGTIRSAIRQNSTVSTYDCYHSRDEIMIDRGNGLESLSAAGLTMNDLPTDRLLHLHSYRPAAGQPIATDAASRLLYGAKRTAILYPPEAAVTGLYPGFAFYLGTVATPSKAGVYAGDPGPKFETFAEASQASLENDTFFYVYATDTGTHVDPLTGAVVNNRGVFRRLRGYGAVRVADAWPANTGGAYATLANLQALVGPFALHARALVTGDGANNGPWEWSGSAWQQVSSAIALPVYASTPGAPSPTNLHVYVTIDHIRKTGASTFTYLSNAAPAITQASTHPDWLQLNLSRATIDGLEVTESVLWDLGQFLFTQGSLASSPVRNFKATRNICAMDLYNSVYLSGAYLSGYEQVVSNNLFMSLAPKDFGAAGISSYPFVYVAPSLAAGQITFENNWFAAAPERNLIDGGSVTSLTSAPKRVVAANVSNYGVTQVPSKPTATSPGLEDAISADQLVMGYPTRKTRFVDVLFSDDFEKRIGISLTAIQLRLKSKMIMSAEVDEMIEWLADNFQREPDHTFYLSASAAVGTVVATGLKAARWHSQWGGAEQGHFTLVAGELKVALPLTGLNFRKMYVADTGLLIDIDVQ